MKHIRADSSLEDHPTNPVALYVKACYACSEATEALEPNAHTEATILETSPEDNIQETGAAFLETLIDYREKASVHVQLGLDKARVAKVCRTQCTPRKWVLTGENELLTGAPEWKAKLVACGSFEQMNGGDRKG